MRKTPEGFYNLFCDKLLKRFGIPLDYPNKYLWWLRYMIFLYNVANQMTGRRYEASEPTVAELLEEWSDVFTCRLFERLGDEIDAAPSLDFAFWPSIQNLDILREYCNLTGTDYPLEMLNNEKISD